MSRLRLSAISFLNTAPLMWDFENGERAAELAKSFAASYTLPSQCAEQLKAGAVDIGIIPVAAYTSIPDLLIVPDVAIASKRAVRSILLISKVPVEKIRSVALDDSSRTSLALVEVFLRKFVGINPGFTPQKPNLEEMLRWHDAALVIGDPALQAQTEGLYVYDLADQWRNWTGRPFVFAFWAVRARAPMGGREELIVRSFQQSRDSGLEHLETIASAWSPRLGLPAQLLQSYLAENIDYTLDGENIEGLQLFFRYAAEFKVLPAAPPLKFLRPAS